MNEKKGKCVLKLSPYNSETSITQGYPKLQRKNIAINFKVQAEVLKMKKKKGLLFKQFT